MTEQPHATLNRAADVLEERAGKATPGPWRSHDTHLDIGGHTATVLTGEPKVVGKPCDNPTRLIAWLPSMSNEPWNQKRNVWNDSEWVATMSPAVAAPLVALLRSTAQYARALAVLQDPHVDQDMHVEHALTFARMVLGEWHDAAEASHEPPPG